MRKFLSILFPDGETLDEEFYKEPACFNDLNLNQVINAIVSRKHDYQLKPFFYSLLNDIKSIHYRQEVFKDIADEALIETLKKFAEKMVLVRRCLNLEYKLREAYHIYGWHLEAVLDYCLGVSELAKELTHFNCKSRGLNLFKDALYEYVHTPEFISMQDFALNVKSKLESIQYNVIIKGNLVRVKKYNGEEDYSNIINQIFSRFRQGNAKDYRQSLVVNSGMNHVEAQILQCVAKLYPDNFDSLEEFFIKYQDFADEMIQRFDREIQFYIAYQEYIQEIRQSGLAFSIPEILDTDKSISAKGTFDIALAYKSRWKKDEIVENDFYLEGEERLIVVSGPNQGGKTTFARNIGQLHFLGCLGCPVPGKDVKIILTDGVYTHFERQENMENLQGKLRDDLLRLKHILENITDKSVVILNEILTSTSLEDAKSISKNILNRIIQKDAVCVCVSFIDELSTLNHQTVSMVSLIDEENPAQRTYKIIRDIADSHAYAIHIAKKHGLTFDLIKERVSK